jgi:mitogen-activated protein kinase kinase 1
MDIDGLRIELEEFERSDSATFSDNTFRAGELSVSMDQFRMNGHAIECEVSKNDLDVVDQIGQGSCSAVFLACHKSSGTKYAIKKYNIFDKHRTEQLLRELEILTLEFRCDSLVRFYGVYHDQGTIGVILEYMDLGSLDFMMNQSVVVTERAMAATIFQIAWGLAFLHYDNNLHRDLKPGNVLMNSAGAVKLSDFGISRSFQEGASVSTFTGTYMFMSPERLQSQPYGAASDIWSLGVMVLQLWEKQYPFPMSPVELAGFLESLDLGRILSRDVYPSAAMRAFLRATLDTDDRQRLQAQEILHDPWLEILDVHSLPQARTVVSSWLKAMGRAPATPAGPHSSVESQSANADRKSHSPHISVESTEPKPDSKFASSELDTVPDRLLDESNAAHKK